MHRKRESVCVSKVMVVQNSARVAGCFTHQPYALTHSLCVCVLLLPTLPLVYPVLRVIQHFLLCFYCTFFALFFSFFILSFTIVQLSQWNQYYPSTFWHHPIAMTRSFVNGCSPPSISSFLQLVVYIRVFEMVFIYASQSSILVCVYDGDDMGILSTRPRATRSYEGKGDDIIHAFNTPPWWSGKLTSCNYNQYRLMKHLRPASSIEINYEDTMDSWVIINDIMQQHFWFIV